MNKLNTIMTYLHRRIFNYDNLSESKIVDFRRKNLFYDNSISAGGCLFYKKNKQLLLSKYADSKWYYLDDIGGQVDFHDDSIMCTIFREVLEETNEEISCAMLSHLFRYNRCDMFYTKQSYYYSFLIQVDDDFFPDTSVFGEIEKQQHERISRIISWYDYDEVKNQLSPRLLNNGCIIDFLDNL
jgi:8-oxo-dGTP pyrophosphatase MutT (NUDIX family)